MKKLTFLLFSMAVLLGCDQNKPVQTNASGNAGFQKLADSYIDGFLAWRPADGVALGYHQYDGKSTDMSKEALGKELGRLKSYDQQLGAIDTTSLSEQAFYDYRILRSAVKNE